MPHHLLKEEDLKEQCVYCGTRLDDKRWISYHPGNMHYKESVCECGKVNRIRTDSNTSGHDNWDGKWIDAEQLEKLRQEIKSKKNLEEKL